MKRDIGQCKSLLCCNREELRRLWLELVEQRRSIELIEVLDRVRAAPEVLKNLITAKAWPEATEYLLKITDVIAKEVDHVPALDTIKAELATRKKTLVEEMRKTLFFLVFNQPVALVIGDKSLRCGLPTRNPKSELSDQLSEFYSSDGRNHAADDVMALNNLPLSDWRSLSSDPPEVDSSLFKDPQAVAAGLLTKRLASGALASSREPKSKVVHHSYGYVDSTRETADRMITDKRQWAEAIVALTHCLHRLQKLSQAFSSWRVKAHSGDVVGDLSGLPSQKVGRNSHEVFAPARGLVEAIHNSITLPAIAEIECTLSAQGEFSSLSSLPDSTYLAELLQILFPSLCMHFNAFMLVLRTIKKIKEQNPGVSFDFLDVLSEEHIWGYIQSEIETTGTRSPLAENLNFVVILASIGPVYDRKCPEVQTVLSTHLSNQKTAPDSSYQTSDARQNAASAAVAVTANFSASKLDLNVLMGKRKGTIPAFLSGATSDSGGSSNSQGGVTSENTSTAFNSGELGAGSFFSFSKTAHNLSVNSYLRENRINMPLDLSSADSIESKSINTDGAISAQADVSRSYPLVCLPSADNVKSIYSMVLTFARVIEMQPISVNSVFQRALSNEEAEATTTSSRNPPPLPPPRAGRGGTGSISITQGLKGAFMAMGAQKMIPKKLTLRCQLRTFLLNFIERLYLPEAEVELRRPLVLAVSSPDALTAIVSQQTQRELGLQRPILLVAYLTNQALGETNGMAIALPDYATNCSKIGLALLETFLNWSSSAYRSISTSGATGLTIPSADWARDKDVSRFWTKFPVWQRMVAADAFVTASTAHSVGNPHDPQPGAVDRKNSTVSGELHQSSAAGSGLSSAAAIVLGLSNLGLNGRSEPVFAGGPSLQAIPFANSFGLNGVAEDGIAPGTSDGAQNGDLPKHADMLLHEREATRLAVKEMDQLLQMIRDEIGSSSELCLPTANMQTVKAMGRLRESVHWLERCVQTWFTWLEGSVPGLDMAPFAAAAEELTSLSNACILTIYLDVRIQAYNFFGNLPRTSNFWCPVDEVDVDPEVTRYLVYLDQLQEVLFHSFCPHELRFIFDGLGDFISQIFLRLIPNITRMNANGNRKMCRNIYKLQQVLALLTENHESDLIRVKQLYELFYLTPEAVVNRIIEQGIAFEVAVYQNLLKLYQRSHPSYDHIKTDESIAKLTQIIRT
ncbi:unnamed protein product [Mesocestoides corti]|uniref:Exocyst complex component Sec8 n=1 Tax=Mesocestoides corti TaxID=53468 RepID=A0A158QUH7_MESCO|nr:unnamed protein product [Mesocestoides corti]